MTLPGVIATYEKRLPLTFFFSTLATFTYLGITKMGNELQDPFGLDANDLDLEETFGMFENDVFAAFPEFRECFDDVRLFESGHYILSELDANGRVLSAKDKMPKGLSRLVQAPVKRREKKEVKLPEDPCTIAIS